MDPQPAGREFTRAARKRGKKIGWYVSGVPVGRAGLNWYTEYPPMRKLYRCRLGCILLKMPAISMRTGARLMAGAAAVKQESDALLCTVWHVIRPA